MVLISNNVNRLFIPILLFISSSIFSQTSKDTIISKEIKKIYFSVMADANEIHRNGQKILGLAKTSKEYIYAYELMSDGLYKKHNYSEALYYYKKRDSLAEKLDDTSGRFYANFFMTNIYQRVGLKAQAKETFSQMVKLSSKLDHKESRYMILQSEAAFLDETYNYCEAIPKKEELLLVTKEIFNENPTSYIKTVLFGSYKRLSYNYLKCEQFDKAADNMKNAESVISGIPLETIDLIYEYYLNKAILAVENHNISEGRYWFDKALSNAEKTKIYIGVMKVLEERINYDIDDRETKKILVKQYEALKQKKKSEAAKIIAQEENIKIETIKRKENYIVLLISILLISGGMVFILVRNYRKRKESEKIKFNQIIEELQRQKSILEKNITKNISEPEPKNGNNSAEEKNENEIVPSVKTISEEKETELLEKLIEFEKGKAYLEKNFTRSNLATLLETNSWYISILLQKHRGKQFSDYVNHIRIEYIVKLLYDNPEYLKYKINYLSDLCGFTSHSRFAQIFKKEKGISPSEFISRLSERHAS